MRLIDKLNKDYNEGKITNKVLIDLYIHHICDYEKLDKIMIQNIYESSSEDKMKIIIALNEILINLGEIILNYEK